MATGSFGSVAAPPFRRGLGKHRYSIVMAPSLRANRFAVLTAPASCHACNRPLTVSALLVPTYVECDEGDDEWVTVDESALLTYVQAVDEATRSAWIAHAPQIVPAASKTAGLTYLSNVCVCGALQGDRYLTEPDGPFFPSNVAGIAAIDVVWVEAPIEARAGTLRSSWTDAVIARSPFPGWAARSTPRVRRRRRGP